MVLVPPTVLVPPAVPVPPIVVAPPASGGLLKVCKVGGPGIPVGTPFTVTAGPNTFTVPSGPAPGGTCVVGPSFPVGTHVTVAETIPAGILVSSIAVAPTVRLDGAPNLAGGSANITIGSGVTEVTFTNKRTGFLEICKTGEVEGSFSFSVNPGGLGPYVVPAGACSPAIEVAAGVVTVHELPSAGSAMSGCTTIPPTQQGACNLEAQISTVTVAPGDISTMTIAFIANKKIDVSLDKKFTKGPTAGTGAFTLLVKNEGAPIAAGTTIKITDPVPVGITLTGFGGVSGTSWSCTPAFPVTGPSAMFACTYTGPGPIASGAVLPALVLNATLAAIGSDTGIYSNCATVALSTAAGPVTESNTANNRACAVTATINPQGCETGKCPPPVAMCSQDVLMVVDASPSIGGGLSDVTKAVGKFLQPMQNKGGNVNIVSFSDKPNWHQITSGGWTPVTSNWATLANPIALGGNRTNWDDALERAHTIIGIIGSSSPKPLVVFITDGSPNAYNDASGQEINSVSLSQTTAATEAVQWINAIRGLGSPIIAIGFGPVVSAGYLEAAFTGNVSGPGNVNFETSSVIKMNSASDLPGVMTALGNQMCGTLSLNKRISTNPNFSHLMSTPASSLSVTDTIPFTLELTNNHATTPMTVNVQDQVPNFLTGVALAGTPSIGNATVGPFVGTGAVTGTLITWSNITLPPRQTTTLSFTGQFAKTYTAPIYETYDNYAQVMAVTVASPAPPYTATTVGSMDALHGPVVEVDESVASFTEQIYQEAPNLCLTASKPASCYFTLSKVRKFPGAEDGSCTSSAPGGITNPCVFAISVNITPTYIPAGSTVTVSDSFTVAGNPVTGWAATVPPSFCPAATPTAVSFAPCQHGSLNSFSGDMTVMIPPGQTGQKSNCITVTIANPTSTPPLNVSQFSCAIF
jgi:hypothetical protein